MPTVLSFEYILLQICHSIFPIYQHQRLESGNPISIMASISLLHHEIARECTLSSQSRYRPRNPHRRSRPSSQIGLRTKMRKNWMAVLNQSAVAMYYAYPRETWGLGYGEQGIEQGRFRVAVSGISGNGRFRLGVRDPRRVS